MRIFRCPRCRAEDISADAHPARLLQRGDVVPYFVCRNCWRAAELEFRVACETNGIPYAPLPVREGLRRLAEFYRERLAEWDDPEIDEVERFGATSRFRRALEEAERQLAIGEVPRD